MKSDAQINREKQTWMMISEHQYEKFLKYKTRVKFLNFIFNAFLFYTKVFYLNYQKLCNFVLRKFHRNKVFWHSEKTNKLI